MNIEAISQREAARRSGVAESTIRHHIASGGLASAVLPDGRLDAAKVARLLPRIVTKGTVTPAALTVARDRRARAQLAELGREVEDMQRRFIPVAEAERKVRPMLDGLAARLRKLPETAGAMTGLPASLVHNMLRDRIHGTLTSISTAAFAERNNDPWWDKPIKREVDLTTLSANDLLARRIELQATKMEIDTMLKAGTVRPVAAIVREAGEQLATAKSLLVAIPGRLAEKVSAATPIEARALMTTEVGHVLAELEATS